MKKHLNTLELIETTGRLAIMDILCTVYNLGRIAVDIGNLQMSSWNDNGHSHYSAVGINSGSLYIMALR